MKARTYDVRLDIPARAYLNHQILRVAEQGNYLYSSKKKVFSSAPYNQQALDLNRYGVLDSPAHIMALMYCLVVVPKEIFETLNYPKDHIMFKRLDKLDISSSFEILVAPKEFEQAPSFTLLHALRNSIAHVLYEFDDTKTINFWTDRNPKWEAKATYEGLSFFLSTFGKELANTLLLHKSRQL